MGLINRQESFALRGIVKMWFDIWPRTQAATTGCFFHSS